MIVILSQRVNFETTYADELYNSYHYPARYKNQLHKGDIFVYYQGNRNDKSQRYYFGMGTIGEIVSSDGENYYAKLINCQKFEKTVPIYLPDGGYIEQLGFETVRKSINPPWQSSIRPLSQKAYDYILNTAGIQQTPENLDSQNIGILKENLKTAIREFYLKNDSSAIYRIESIASAIGRAISVKDENNVSSDANTNPYSPSESSETKYEQLLEYCRSMKMSYSYKPVLIMALLHKGNSEGNITVQTAAKYFRSFYEDRKSKGLAAEKKKCIYTRDNLKDDQIIENIISNPVKALTRSGFFFFNEEGNYFSMSPEIWYILDKGKKAAITKICNQKLNTYFEV